MTTATTPQLPELPVGADPESDDWQTHDGVTQRLVWSPQMPLPEGVPDDIRVVVCQRLDGSIATDGSDAPLIYNGVDDLTPTDARAVGLALLAAADLADTWAGQSASVDSLRALMLAIEGVRSTLPGEAAAYADTAIYALDDALHGVLTS